MPQREKCRTLNLTWGLFLICDLPLSLQTYWFVLFRQLRQAANTLWNNSLFLATLQTNRLLPMKNAAQRLRLSASKLEERIRFNQSSLSEAIEMLIGQAEAAQTFLRNKGPEQLTKVRIPFSFPTDLLPPSLIEIFKNSTREYYWIMNGFNCNNRNSLAARKSTWHAMMRIYCVVEWFDIDPCHCWWWKGGGSLLMLGWLIDCIS